jgi:hypothetical protein
VKRPDDAHCTIYGPESKLAASSRIAANKSVNALARAVRRALAAIRS